MAIKRHSYNTTAHMLRAELTVTLSPRCATFKSEINLNKGDAMALFAIVVLALALVVFLWAMGTYNRLIVLKNEIANAYGQIDVQLKRRYDLIPNLV